MSASSITPWAAPEAVTVVSESRTPLEMFVQFVGDPARLRFSVNRSIEGAPAEWFSSDETDGHGLAERLFDIDGVISVHLEESIVSIGCSSLDELEAIAARAELVVKHYLR